MERKGIVRISKIFFQDTLGFPPDWNIEEIALDGDVFISVISGSDFPEVVPIKQCEVLFHKEDTRVEVREIN